MKQYTVVIIKTKYALKLKFELTFKYFQYLEFQTRILVHQFRL